MRADRVTLHGSLELLLSAEPPFSFRLIWAAAITTMHSSALTMVGYPEAYKDPLA